MIYNSRLFRSAYDVSLYVYVRRSCFADNFAGTAVDLAETDCTVSDSDRMTGVVAEIVRRERFAIALVGWYPKQVELRAIIAEERITLANEY